MFFFLTVTNCQNCSDEEILCNVILLMTLSNFKDHSQCFPLCQGINPPSNCIFCGSNCYECKDPVLMQCARCRRQEKYSAKALFLYNYKCVEECPEGLDHNFTSFECVNCIVTLNQTFRDTLNRACVDCPKGCFNCGMWGCESCAQEYYPPYSNGRLCCLHSQEYFSLETQSCSPCPAHCLSCDSNGKCLSCSSGFSVSNTGCCPPGQYFNSLSNSCLDCMNICLECDNAFSCSKCNENVGYFRSNKACCPSGSFFSELAMKCLKCLDSCSSCLNENTCINCVSGDVSQGHCCGLGRYFDNKDCVNCSENCLQCSGRGECFLCQNSFFLSNGFCCPQAHYYSIENQVCSPCFDDEKCIFCDNGEKLGCIECEAGYYSSKGVCCSEGTFYSDDSGSCIPCGNNCSRCLNSSYCIKCADTFSLNVDQHRCCDYSQYYSQKESKCSPCPENCLVCIQTGKCLKCNNGFNLGNGVCSKPQKACFYISDPSSECLESCPSQYFAQEQHCLECSEGCSECVSSSNCIECQTGYIFYENSCLADCPKGKFYDSTSDSCQKCNEACSECFGSEEKDCLTCPEGFFIKGTVCAKQTQQKGNLTFAITMMENFTMDLNLNMEIIVPSYLNLGMIFNFSVLGNSQISGISYDVSFIPNRTIAISMLSTQSLRKPSLKIVFNENCYLYLRTLQNQTFYCQKTSLSAVFPNYFVYPSGFEGQIDLINYVFMFIFYIILTLMIISWFFNPRRDSLLWYMVDSFQLTYFTIFINMDFPRNLEKFLLSLNIFNLDFFLSFGKNEKEESIYFFDNPVEAPNYLLRNTNNIYKYLGTSNFIVNCGWAFFLLILLWVFYFFCKIILNSLRIHSFDQKKHNGVSTFLMIFDKIHRNTLFSFNLRISFFFSNSIVFSALIQLRYFNENRSPIALFLSLIAIIYFAILSVKCYYILNNPLVYNDEEQKSHYLTIFKDVSTDFFSRNHHLIIQNKKFSNMFIIALFGEFPLPALILLLIVQIMGVGSTNVMTLAFVIGLFKLWIMNQNIAKGSLVIEEITMYWFIDIGSVEVSFIYMLNVIYLCLMVFIFFGTCASNLDCICFFLIFEEKEEKEEGTIDEERGKEEREVQEIEKKEKIIELSQKNQKIVENFSHVKESSRYI